MNWLKTLVLVVAMLIVGSLAALSVNQQEIVLSFAIWQTPFALSMFWWLLAAFLIGLLFGTLASLWTGAKRRLELRKLRKTVAQSNAELERLRDITLKG
ncbi:MAG: LapA family protein [Pseudomonadales bacterium]